MADLEFSLLDEFVKDQEDLQPKPKKKKRKYTKRKKKVIFNDPPVCEPSPPLLPPLLQLHPIERPLPTPPSIFVYEPRYIMKDTFDEKMRYIRRKMISTTLSKKRRDGYEHQLTKLERMRVV